MSEAYIVGAVRTACGRRNGRLRNIHPVDLGAAVVDELLDRSAVSADVIDDVIFGCVSQIGAQAGNLARNVVLASRLDISVPGVTVDRQCGSSLQAIQFGAQAVMSQTQDMVICGGVECMSLIPIGSNISDGIANGRGVPRGERIDELYPGIEFSQFTGAELLGNKYHLSRLELDKFGVLSHQRAAHATRNGYFHREIVPVEVTTEAGDIETHTVDEGIRYDASLDAMSGLQPLRPGGLITAGTASQISDGAAAVLVASRRAVERYNLPVRARIHTLATVGSDPEIMLEGPIPATEKLLERADLTIDDIDLYEVNEAFGSVPLAWAKAVGADLRRLNVNGGAQALGHPLGATGAKLTTTLLHELERREARFGLVVICEGGGTANAMLIERVDSIDW
ncbi:MAG: acetyl-CoA C-acyltransferase [Pseudohongiella sp.]|nr:acetyl-CoA C-acyltransferase [Pseudohongiella sp.]|tara:strand:+ start:1827 stop:3014 length:1188 start_codon:yes stop_codon:yes gene_type:complete